MTMTGVILVAVLSGAVSLFISQVFLRKRMGLGLAIIFFLPIASMAVYFVMTTPRFGVVLQGETTGDGTPFMVGREIPPMAAEELQKLEARVKARSNNLNLVLALADGYMSREEYDAAIGLLEPRYKKQGGKRLTEKLTTTHFAKGLYFAEHRQYRRALIALREAQQIAPAEATYLPDIEHFISMCEEQLEAERQREAEAKAKQQAEEGNKVEEEPAPFGNFNN